MTGGLIPPSVNCNFGQEISQLNLILAIIKQLMPNQNVILIVVTNVSPAHIFHYKIFVLHKAMKIFYAYLY